MIHFRVRYERLRGRLGQVRRRAALLRATWLALLAGLAHLLAEAASGVDLPLLPWIVGAGAIFVAALVWQVKQSGEQQLDRELDRRFRLDDLIVTAVEVDRRGARSAVEGRLLDDAATAVATLGGERAIDSRAARLEAEAVVALLLVVVGGWLLLGAMGRDRPVERLPELPGLGAGGEGDASGFSAGVGPGPGGGSQGMRVLADALSDHAAARGIAAALMAGDAASAARSARALADRAAELSPAGRKDLAEILREAAAAIEATDPSLAQVVWETSRSLESADPEDAIEGVERLAAELDALAKRSRGSAGSPSSPEHDRTGPLTRRLPVEPQEASWPVPEPGTSGFSRGGAARGRADRQEEPGATVSGGLPRSERQPTAPDPLRYPWALRDTVQDYFSPAGSGQ